METDKQWQLASKDFVFSLMLQSLLAESNFFEQFNYWSVHIYNCVCVVDISIIAFMVTYIIGNLICRKKRKRKKYFHLVMHDAY